MLWTKQRAVVMVLQSPGVMRGKKSMGANRLDLYFLFDLTREKSRSMRDETCPSATHGFPHHQRGRVGARRIRLRM